MARDRTETVWLEQMTSGRNRLRGAEYSRHISILWSPQARRQRGEFTGKESVVRIGWRTDSARLSVRIWLSRSGIHRGCRCPGEHCSSAPECHVPRATLDGGWTPGRSASATGGARHRCLHAHAQEGEGGHSPRHPLQRKCTTGGGVGLLPLVYGSPGGAHAAAVTLGVDDCLLVSTVPSCRQRYERRSEFLAALASPWGAAVAVEPGSGSQFAARPCSPCLSSVQPGAAAALFRLVKVAIRYILRVMGI